MKHKLGHKQVIEEIQNRTLPAVRRANKKRYTVCFLWAVHQDIPESRCQLALRHRLRICFENALHCCGIRTGWSVLACVLTCSAHELPVCKLLPLCNLLASACSCASFMNSSSFRWLFVTILFIAAVPSSPKLKPTCPSSAPCLDVSLFV